MSVRRQCWPLPKGITFDKVESNRRNGKRRIPGKKYIPPSSRYGVHSPQSWSPLIHSTERSVSYDGISRAGSGITGSIFLAENTYCLAGQYVSSCPCFTKCYNARYFSPSGQSRDNEPCIHIFIQHSHSHLKWLFGSLLHLAHWLCTTSRYILRTYIYRPSLSIQFSFFESFFFSALALLDITSHLYQDLAHLTDLSISNARQHSQPVDLHPRHFPLYLRLRRRHHGLAYSRLSPK